MATKKNEKIENNSQNKLMAQNKEEDPQLMEILDDDDIVMDMWREVETETPEWKAPTIFARTLWKPIMKAFWLIYRQERRNRTDNLAVYGNTDTGKTTCKKKMIASFRKKHNLSEHDILDIDCLTNMTVTGLYHQILDKLHWEFLPRDNIADLERRVRNAIIDRGVKLLVIDEFSNVMNNFHKRDRDNVLKALRNIPTLTKCPIIVFGTRKILDLLQEDPETNNRYEKIEFPRFELGKGKWKDFQQILATLDEAVEKDTKIISTLSEDRRTLEKLFRKSRGKMGSLIKIYERTVQIALEEGKDELNSKLIDKAVRELNKSERLDDAEIAEIEPKV
ncbi:MAG: TniB family NTP-binding protein, partial [Promethearchaeota archaeon]